MDKDKNVKVLEEVCKGVKMGMNAISYVSDKVEDDNLTEYLKHEYSMYNNILDKVNDAFANYGADPNRVSLGSKAMLWYGVQLNTLMDKSNSKISELLLQGTNMGIIEGKRLLNQNTDLDTDVENLLTDFIDFQEESVEKLKNFL